MTSNPDGNDVYDPDSPDAEVEEALYFKKYNERFEKWPYRQAFFAPSK